MAITTSPIDAMLAMVSFTTGFRTIQVRHKDLLALPRQAQPAVIWHSRFPGGDPARHAAPSIHIADWRGGGVAAGCAGAASVAGDRAFARRPTAAIVAHDSLPAGLD